MLAVSSIVVSGYPRLESVREVHSGGETSSEASAPLELRGARDVRGFKKADGSLGVAALDGAIRVFHVEHYPTLRFVRRVRRLCSDSTSGLVLVHSSGGTIVGTSAPLGPRKSIRVPPGFKKA
jgi:hypothetical protein